MTHRDIKLIVQTVLWTLFVLAMGWIFWSWWDVVIHNCSGGTENAMNLFRILLGK